LDHEELAKEIETIDRIRSRTKGWLLRFEPSGKSISVRSVFLNYARRSTTIKSLQVLASLGQFPDDAIPDQTRPLILEGFCDM